MRESDLWDYPEQSYYESTGFIVGICLGGAFLLASIGFIIGMALRFHRKKRTTQPEAPEKVVSDAPQSYISPTSKPNVPFYATR